eukprot:8722158-Pyramimonas_sp.AAC.1
MAMRRSLYIAGLMAREIGSDSAALRTVLKLVASLSGGRPALTFSYAPTKKGALQVTTANRLSPKIHLALQYIIRNSLVVPVRLAKSIHKLPPVTSADSCALVHYDNDVSPGFHYYEAE